MGKLLAMYTLCSQFHSSSILVLPSLFLHFLALLLFLQQLDSLDGSLHHLFLSQTSRLSKLLSQKLLCFLSHQSFLLSYLCLLNPSKQHSSVFLHYSTHVLTNLVLCCSPAMKVFLHTFCTSSFLFLSMVR